jgi:replicative DNA helicase
MIPVPEDPDSERSLLATLCAPGAETAAAVLVPTLQEQDFIVPAHRCVFLALRALVARGEESAPATLRAEMETQGTLTRAGGIEGLHGILDAQEVGKPEVLLRIIQAKRRQRELQKLGESILRTAATTEPGELIESASKELTRLSLFQNHEQAEKVNGFSDEALVRIHDKMLGKSNVGCKFHSWPRLNGLTQGFQPGQLIVLAARPGIGKTALALNWFLRAGMNGKRCLYFSLEMSKEELWNRLISDKSGVDLRKMVENRDMESFDHFAAAKREVDLLQLHVDERGKITTSAIQAQVDRLIAKHGRVDLVVVDYLQLLSSAQGNKNQTETIRIGEITRALKILAKDRHVPIVLLSQLNREVEKRSSARPQLSDLRDSGCIEQDADLVMFIHRNMKETNADLILAKHRNGPVMTLPLQFDPAITRYIELERNTETWNPSSEIRQDLLEDLA